MGAPEDVLRLSTQAGTPDGPAPMTPALRAALTARFEAIGADGMRALGLAARAMPADQDGAEVADEAGLTFAGFAVFLASRPGLGVAAGAFTLALPALPFGAWFGLVAPPVRYFAALLPVAAGFLVVTELAKRLSYARLLGKQPAAVRPSPRPVPSAT